MLTDFFGGSKLISRITPLDARQFINFVRQSPKGKSTLATATVNKIIREARRIFREAVDCELIHTNPFDRIRQDKNGEKEWQYVSPTHFRSLLQAAPSDRWRGIIHLAYCCGLRQGEILNLTWSDIDFERRMLRIAPKAGDDLVKSWLPKDKDSRLVPIPSQTLDTLTTVQIQANEGQVYVFVIERGPNTGNRMKRSNFPREFQVIRKRAGIPKCTFHDLRRCYCTNLAGSVPLHVVQELAGHADIRTTRKHYLQVRQEELDAAREAAERVLK